MTPIPSPTPSHDAFDYAAPPLPLSNGFRRPASMAAVVPLTMSLSMFSLDAATSTVAPSPLQHHLAIPAAPSQGARSRTPPADAPPNSNSSTTTNNNTNNTSASSRPRRRGRTRLNCLSSRDRPSQADLQLRPDDLALMQIDTDALCV
ncbi:hypothetical protein BCR33DRAFT_716752 [Rhizoclosmatium globosum]|uniref:Uncharacterized protein n=1 Tax=Rhizoclosmatium globosum TaxID=329046 RepID=A0A1Y2CET1_9FUNG|nr:hypothetical protein BCR33DRAFT_716752 [Rhizoclosmatium globosum]|eukprot:ORY44805.1 hypothetical protein BCR33DRAFT_716752 [Rhizoclosmatium globosum]